MTQVATLQQPKRSLVDSMAAKYEMEPAAFVSAIKATVIKGDCSNEQFAAFLMVAKEYDLNPLTKEIYAFPDRGGITPIVSIDGWMNLINSHPQFDGMEFDDNIDDNGKLVSVECRMYRKDRNRHTSVIEYMSECFRQTDPWKKWPNRMLRHKAAIQCARYAFGFSGIMEPDEYERMRDITPAERPSVKDRLQASAAAAPYSPTSEREGFSASSVHQQADRVLTGDIVDGEPHDPETGEITEQPNSDDAPLTSSEADDAVPSPRASSNEPAEDPAPSAGSPIPEKEAVLLRRFAKDVLTMANKPETSGEAMTKVVNRWINMELTSIQSDEGRAAVKSIHGSVKAIMKGDVDYEVAVGFHAEGLGCESFDIMPEGVNND